MGLIDDHCSAPCEHHDHDTVFFAHQEAWVASQWVEAVALASKHMSTYSCTVWRSRTSIYDPVVASGLRFDSQLLSNAVSSTVSTVAGSEL